MVPWLVLQIAPSFDRLLPDRTELAGGYDFSLEFVTNGDTSKWSPEEKAALGKGWAKRWAVTPLRASATRVEVVSAKDVVEVLVVDHVERPSAN
jgi:uncharacterized protein (TIGR03435 family)